MDKAKRMKALEGYRDFLDVYLNRPMNAQEQQIFDDCADCKISFEEYKNRLIELTLEQGRKLTSLFSDNDGVNESRKAETAC